ncbi:hypothetical protein LPJ75_004630, partial [Coemansia sp. RSA 2598]
RLLIVDHSSSSHVCGMCAFPESEASCPKAAGPGRDVEDPAKDPVDDDDDDGGVAAGSTELVGDAPLLCWDWNRLECGRTSKMLQRDILG